MKWALLAIPASLLIAMHPGVDRDPGPGRVAAAVTVGPVLVPAPELLPTHRPVLVASAHPAPSRKRRASRERVVPGYRAWANSEAARSVAQCESGNDGSARSHTGKYRGKWQMDADFWKTYGGLRFASSPDLASEDAQDLVAYRGFRSRGWQPWTCAHIVGLI